MKALIAALALAMPVPLPAAVTERLSTAPDGSTTISHSVAARARLAVAWKAVATVEGWKCWAVPVAWAQDGNPQTWETAYKPDAKPGDPGNIIQRFRIVRKGRELIFRTIKTPQGFPHAQAFASVENRFVLSPARVGTRIELRSSGYPASEGGKALVAFFREGNRVSLEALAAHLEGKPGKSGGESCRK